MINILKLVGRLINGITFASYELDTLTYRAEPIKQRQSVVIPGLKAGMAMVVDLNNVLKYNLLVTGIDADMVEDDTTLLESDGSIRENFLQANLFVNVINRKTGLVVKRLSFQISSYPSYTNEIILIPDHIYEFKPTRDINSITFTGEPVHLRDPIIFQDIVMKEDLSPRGGN